MIAACRSCGTLTTHDGVCPGCETAEVPAVTSDVVFPESKRFPVKEAADALEELLRRKERRSLLGDDSRSLLFAMPLAHALGGVSCGQS
jgi:hypothetical protein